MKKIYFLLSCLLFNFLYLQAQPTFLGLTQQGGGYGTISKYDAATNTISTVHSFQTKGLYPTGKMLKAADGKLYGMTREGGAGYGVIFSFDPASSTYVVVKNFDNTNGAYPYGSLIQASDGKLYGMTQQGGISGYGVIFSFDPASSIYTVVKNFDNTNGGYPLGSLVQASNGKLYGMARQGGTGYGVIFSFDPASSSYTVLKNFDNTTGSYPYGSLIQASNGKLYGMTVQGGTSGYGVIFSFDAASSVYAVVKNFDYTNGGNPYGSLMQASNGKLYGMTYYGGTSGYGVVFSFDAASSTYAVVKNFDYTNGGYPYGSLMQASNGKLYGMTYQGGTSGYGVVFSFDATSSAYAVVKNFDYTNGGYPYINDLEANTDGKLYGTTQNGGVNGWGVIFSLDPTSNVYNKLFELSSGNGYNPLGSLYKANNGKFYGMTAYGGTSGYGVIFSFDAASSTYAVVKNFDYTNGGYPYGSLMQASNGKLYGMTVNGGTSGYGVIFSFDPATSIYAVLKNFDNTSGGNPYGALIQANNGKLYGMTYQGGTSGYGVIFSFDPASSAYAVVKNFDNTTGSYPFGSLIQANNGKLYGMTQQGGTSGYGVIFSFDPISSTYSGLKNFDNTGGANPNGSLMQATNGKLYGMTVNGGTSNYGVIFSFDPASSTYAVASNFDNTNGRNPFGSLIQASNGKLYGMTRQGGTSNYGVIFSFDLATSTYIKQDFNRANGAYPLWSDLVETDGCNPITVTAVASNNATGPVLPKTMTFGAGNDVVFVGQGPSAKLTGGRTNIYSAINTSSYGGLWWTFTPIENPRHSSQGSSTGQMVFNNYNAATGIITFTSTANMVWPGVNGTENIATRVRMQLQPYIGSHSGPIGSGWITPVTAGGISLASLAAGYPLIDIKAIGATAAYQVWYAVETAGGIPLDDYYNNPLHNSTVGGSTQTSLTGSFFSSTLSTCNGGLATVTVTATGGVEPYTGTGVFSATTGDHTYTVTDFNGCSGSSTITILPPTPIVVTAVASNNATGPVLPKTMTFGAGNDVVFVGQGPGAKLTGGRTNIYSAINTSSYGGLWWTFTPIENPRHSSQGSSTGQMVFNNYNAATGIITFTSTANMIWPGVNGTENIATRVRMQLQPYTGSHSGPIGSGCITPVTAGGISLASLAAGYPLIDIKAIGATAAYQVWYAVETAGGIPLDDYYNNPLHNSTVGGSTQTSLTGSFFSSTLSTCNGGLATVTVTATGGVEPYTGTGVFPATTGDHTYTVTDFNGCSGSATIDVEGQNCIELQCVENKIVSTDAGSCVATVMNIDPIITPSNAIVNYKIEKGGIELETGVGSVSGKTFAKGITTVTYTAADEPIKTCSFTVTVTDDEKPTFTCPDNQNVNLNATCQLIVPNLIAGLTGSDNCGTVTFTQSPVAGASLASSHNQNHNVLITASDGNGNTQTCTVVLTGKDVTQPTFNCPSNQNVNLNATCQLIVPNLIAGLTGSDNCGTVTFTQSPVAGASLASSHNQNHNVLITASDGNGNTQTCTVVLTGKDVTQPTFNCPSNQNVNLNATCQLIVPNLIAGLTGSDNCGTVTFTQSPVAGASLASSHNQNHNVLIAASDGNGNTQTCTVVLTGKDVTQPTFNCPSNQNVNLNGSCQLIVPNLIAGLTGSDNCGTVTFTQSPLAGAPLGSSHNQTHNILITASDGNGNTQTCTAVLTGKDVTQPTFNCPSNQNVNLNATCQLIVPNLIAGLTGSDNCGTVTFTQSPVAGAPLASSHNQTHNILITANDGNGNTQTCTVVLTGKDVTKPTFNCPDNQNINLNATCQLSVPNLISGLTGNDNCGIVTFTQSPSAGAFLASSHNQAHNVLITASDGNGNTQTCTVVLTGKDVTKPTFSCPYNQNINLNGTCQLIVPNLISGLTGNDNCGTVTFTQSPVANASLASSHNQTHNIMITADDGNGNTQTCTVVLTGKDVTKPTFTCPTNRNVNLNGTCQLIVPNLIYGLTGYDNCGTVTFTQSPLAGASFASSHNQTQNVLITANDGNGNTETCTVVLTAKDITPPVITTCPSPKTISCDASILPANTGSATATDNCSGVPVITYSDVSGQDPNPSHAGYYNYTITRTWKAMDVATNTSTCNQTITVQDITKPMITCPANKLNVAFDFEQLYATLAIGTATATDNCAANANIAIAGTRSDNVVITNQQYPLGQTTVAWFATDPSDNSYGCTQTVTVRKRNTAVTYTGDMIDGKICVQYSDIINLQAKLTDNEGLVTPNNISGRTITFQLLSGVTVLRSKSSTTNASGVAIDTFKIEQAPALYSVKTIFAGDSYFNGSNDQDNCEVKQEDALVEYNGSQYFTTPSATTLIGSITLAASVNDIDDGIDKRGDIRKAKATFRDGGPAGTVLGSANLPVGLVNPGILTNGLSATTQNNITLNSNEASSGGKIFQVWVGASDHYKGADAGPTPVTLALPGQDFVTGGGHLVVTNSAGTYAGTANSKMNFGFTMKWNKSGKSLQGNINIVFRKWQLYNGVLQWRVYQAKSNSINSMAVVEVGSNGQPATATNPAMFRKAIINTKANLKDVTDPLNNIDLGGNHNLTLDAWDHITANGGVSDKISVTLMSGATNELLFSSSWISNVTAAQTINGGNINVRNGSSSSTTSVNSITKSGQMEVAVKEDAFVVKAYPNPTEHEFILIVNSSLNEKIEIQLYDAVGRKIQTLSANANETIRFGEKLKTGVYIAQVIQGNKKKSIKLIKQ